MHRGETSDVHLPWSVGVHLDLVFDSVSTIAASSQEISEGLIVDLDKRGLHVVLQAVVCVCVGGGGGQVNGDYIANGK